MDELPPGKIVVSFGASGDFETWIGAERTTELEVELEPGGDAATPEPEPEPPPALPFGDIDPFDSFDDPPRFD